MGRKIGYARVSTNEQELALQLDELDLAGCQLVFSDQVSGARAERKGLEDCLATLGKGDTLVVWRLDRLGRSMSHLVSIIEELRSEGIHFQSLSDGAIDTTTASGELIFHFFAALAQFERTLIQERTQAGLEAARARGKKGGRKPKSAEDKKVRMAKAMHRDGSMSISDLCSSLDISKATFYRYLKL